MTEQRIEIVGAGSVASGGAPGRDPHRGDVVSLRVKRVAWASSLVERLRLVGDRLWALPLVALALVVVDAVFALPAWARAGLGVLVIMLAARAVLGMVWPSRGIRMSALGAARIVEKRLGVPDNAVVNAMQLRGMLVSPDGVTAVLAERAVDHGVDVVRRSEGARMVDARGAARAWGFAAGASILVGISILLVPRVWASGVVRYVDPFGGHPVYSPTVFGVEVSPREVLAGDDATVTVLLGGVIPASVEMVFVDGGGLEIDRAAMGVVGGAMAEGERPSAYRLTLRDLREPVRFFAEAETGRGRVVEIVPLDKPRVVSATLVVDPPSYTGLATTTQRVDRVEGAVSRRVLLGTEVVLAVEWSVDLGDVDRLVGTVTGTVDVSGRTAMQRVVLGAPGEELLSIRGVSRSGLRSDDAVRVELGVVEDAHPRVLVRAPAGEGERAAVLEGAGVPVRATAEDDVRVGEIGVEWRVGLLGENEPGLMRRAPMETTRGTRASAEGVFALDTGGMGVVAGDEIEIWVTASDERGIAFGGPQVTRVGPVRVSVIDEEEFHRRTLARLGVDDIVGAYEEIARESSGLARDAAELARRARDGEAEERDAARAAEGVQQRRDALMGEVERRLASEPLVDFDEEMRGALERLRERLEGFEEQPAPGETGDDAAERTARNAERLDLAGREAALDLGRASERLRRAVEMRRQLKRLDGIVKRQRALADRLTGVEEIGAFEGTRLAEEQLGLMADVDRVCARLDALGDRAANELPGAATLEGAELELSRTRREAQEAMEAARGVAGETPSNVLDSLARRELRDAADAALTDLYFATDPAMDSVGSLGEVIEQHGARVDTPKVGAEASDVRESIRRALEAVEALEERLERVRDRVRRDGANQTAQVPRSAPVALFVLWSLFGALDGEEEAPLGDDAIDRNVEERFALALEVARVRLGALKVRLREAEDAASPALPVMGGSAMELADRVVGSEVAETMHDAEWAMSEGDLTAARERAESAAARLESLYESAVGGSGEAGGSCEDSPLRLMEMDGSSSPGDSNDDRDSSGGSSGLSAGSSGGGGGSAGGLPNALDMLSESAGGGERAGSQRESEEGSGGGEPGDRGGFERAGSLPEHARGRGDSGAPGGAGDSGTGREQGEPREGGGDPSLADRARRFNERLYSDPVEIDRPVEGEGGADGERIDADAIRLEGDPVDRAGVVRGMFAGSGMDAAEIEAVFERVPPAYRDVVAAYLMRIARDEASAGGRDEENGSR